MSKIYIKEIRNIERPDYLGGNNWNLEKLKPLTLILGRNGCGKTTLLNNIASKLRDKGVNIEGGGDILLDQKIENTIQIKVDKISAERGGNFNIDGGILSQLSTDPGYTAKTRQGSKSNNFRSEVASRYDKLMALLSIHDNSSSERPYIKRETIINLLGTLLPQKYKLKSPKGYFKIVTTKDEKESVEFDKLSSGEIEMFTIGLECLISVNWQYEYGYIHKVLVIDEPDVHIHPDLQIRFLEFIYKLVEEFSVQVFIGTHSSVFVTNMESKKSGIVWMSDEKDTLKAQSKNEMVGEIAPIIGGHIITQILMNNKILLVEGYDDETVWRKAASCSNENMNLYVQKCHGKSEMIKIETAIERILTATCDGIPGSPFIISIRDKDDGESEIDDRKFVKRFKTECREIENCILSNEFLNKYDKTIEGLTFKGDRKHQDIKAVAPSISKEITGSDIDWRVILGGIIGSKFRDGTILTDQSENSITTFLGKNFLGCLKTN